MAPLEKPLVQALTERISKHLNLDAMMVESHTYPTKVSSLCLFHGKAPKRSVSTFDKEQKQPKRLRYTPTRRLMLIFDPVGGLFYISAQARDIGGILLALNGTVFPERAPDAPFKTLSVNLKDLSPSLYMTLPARTYSSVQLKTLCGHDFGYNATSGKIEWSGDGFAALHLGAHQWPPYATEARLLIHAKGYDAPFTLTVYDGTGVIKAPLSEKTFWPIAEILRRCTGDYETYHDIPITYNGQVELDLTQNQCLGELKEPPYILSEEPIPCICEAPPKRFECKCTPYGKCSLKCYPHSKTDALRIIHTHQSDKHIHCILFDRPQYSSKIPPQALLDWSEEAAKHTHKVVCICTPGQKYPCGNTPICQTHQGCKATEQCETFEEQVNDYNTFSEAVRTHFKEMDNDERLILHRWSTEDEPGQSNIPIRVSTLAKLLNCSIYKIYRTIRKAEKINRKIVDRMKAARDDRARQTHGYNVSEA